MVQEVKRYISEDGREFLTEKQAVEWEKLGSLIGGLKHHMEREVSTENHIDTQDHDSVHGLANFLNGEKQDILDFYGIHDDGFKRIPNPDGINLNWGTLKEMGVYLIDRKYNAQMSLIKAKNNKQEWFIGLWHNGEEKCTVSAKAPVIFGLVGLGKEQRTIVSLGDKEYSVHFKQPVLIENID